LAIVNRKSYIYTVSKGDTLYKIAQRFGSSVEAIKRANYLVDPVTDPGLIYPGNVLVVPSLSETGKVTYIVKSGNTVSGIASSFNTFSDLVAGINDLDNPNTIFPDQLLTVPVFIYEIQAGDTLSSISSRFGIPLSRINKANQNRLAYSGNLIWPEFHLILPLPTSQNIVVRNPLPRTKIVNGQKIEGQARAFEANVLYQLRDANGTIVSNERSTMADKGAPKYGNFSSTLLFDRTPTSNTGELWVYTRSPIDGSIQDLVKTKVDY
jgi:LysM repeat protein